MSSAGGPFDLTGRSALVTGASRGIGSAIAAALDRAGARVALAGMIDRGRGSIVSLSSVSGIRGTPRRSAYAASKGAIELGPHGIRVNTVAPGVVDTDMWARNKTVAGVVEAVEAQTALRRWGQPGDIADVVVFLASDAARFITGETVSADGGMAATLDLYAGGV